MTRRRPISGRQSTPGKQLRWSTQSCTRIGVLTRSACDAHVQYHSVCTVGAERRAECQSGPLRAVRVAEPHRVATTPRWAQEDQLSISADLQRASWARRATIRVPGCSGRTPRERRPGTTHLHGHFGTAGDRGRLLREGQGSHPTLRRASIRSGVKASPATLGSLKY